MSVSRPPSMTGREPCRSSSLPVSGDSANIPAVCADRVIPTAPSPWPFMCIASGAAVMTATITTWPVTITASA